ncbi:MAG TPA: urease accessory UreF family protein [Burkholderiaceae bacterium]|nr:urease accessory UreF family protein [Burkholderiaceae bacterium]
MLSRLLQLSSPALPIGAYSYSSGLEAAIDGGVVHDETSARQWVVDALQLAVGAFDAPLMVAAYRAWSAQPACEPHALRALNAQALAARESAELRLETEQMGFSLGRWIADVCAGELAPTPAQRAALESLDPPALPLAWALAAQRLGVTQAEAAESFLWSFAENQAMVLIKALPIGQIAAQRLLLALGPQVADVARRACELPPELWSSAAPGLAIASMRHETQYSRLFRS